MSGTHLVTIRENDKQICTIAIPEADPVGVIGSFLCNETKSIIRLSENKCDGGEFAFTMISRIDKRQNRHNRHRRGICYLFVRDNYPELHFNYHINLEIKDYRVVNVIIGLGDIFMGTPDEVIEQINKAKKEKESDNFFAMTSEFT